MGVFKKKGQQQPLLLQEQREAAPVVAAAKGAGATGGGGRKGPALQVQLLPRFARFQRVGSKDSADTRLSSVGSDPDHAPEYVPPPPFEVLQGGAGGSGGSTRSLPFRTAAAPPSPAFHALEHGDEDDDETLTADGSLIRGGAAVAGTSSVADSDCGEYEPPPTTLLPPALLPIAGDGGGTDGNDRHTPADDDTATVEGTFRQFVFDPAGGIAGVEERRSDPGDSASDIFRIAAARTLNVQSTAQSPPLSQPTLLRRPSFDQLDREVPVVATVHPESVFDGLHDADAESAFDMQHPPVFPALVASAERISNGTAPGKHAEPKVAADTYDGFGHAMQTDDFDVDRSQKIVDELFSPERQRSVSKRTNDLKDQLSVTSNQSSVKPAGPSNVPVETGTNPFRAVTNPFRSGGSMDDTSFLDKGSPLKPIKRLDLASVGPLTRQQTDDRSITSRSSRQSYSVSLHQRHTPTRRRPKSPDNVGDAFKVIDATARPYSVYAGTTEGTDTDAPAAADAFASLTAHQVSRLEGVLSSAPRPRMNGSDSILSNANATVFSRAVRTAEARRDPFAFPLDEVESPQDPFKIGKDTAAPSAWDVTNTPTFETNSSDALIDSIRRASSKRSEPCDSSTRTPPRPDPSPRGRPESSGVQREFTNTAPDAERESVPETLGIQPSSSDSALEKPSGQLNRAILGSMLCRQMDSIATMEQQHQQRSPVRPVQQQRSPAPPSQLVHRSRATAPALRAAAPAPATATASAIGRVPSTIERSAHDDATVSDVTEAVSSHYLSSFEAWKSQARSALSHYGGLRMGYRPNSSGGGGGDPSRTGTTPPSQRVTWMHRVQEEHQRMFLASERGGAGADPGAAPR